jgi:photosystem II stability/assembly factor-like uncharacterized protein
MTGPKGVTRMPRVYVLVGTRKGAFIYSSDGDRQRWTVSEPLLRGSSIFSMYLDVRRDPPRLFAASNHWAWGRSAARSDDFGKTWEQRTPGLSFEERAEPVPNIAFDSKGGLTDKGPLSVENIWAIAPGHASQPGVVWAGTQPAGLFKSEDWGESWAPVDSLNYRPERKYWYPTGGGASSLHTVEVDPRDANRVYASIASGGTYVTEDGGGSWRICSHNAIATTPEARAMIEQFAGSNSPFEVPEGVDPAAADEFHKFRLDRKNPDRLWGQAHIGVFRSDNCGDTWHDVTEGLPSFHGFPIAVTRRDADAVFVVPLEFAADNFRVCPGQFAVYRTVDAGKTWERLTRGLPGPDDYQSAYRDAMDTDGCASEGVYVGTTNGAVYFGRERGEHWERLPGTLPPILSVTAIEVL